MSELSTPGSSHAPRTPRAARAGRESRRSRLLKMPGMIARAVYMFLLTAIIVASVARGGAGPAYLVLAALFVVGAIGLLLFYRWGWALTLAAAALSSATFLFNFFTQHAFYALEQGLISLVIFLYLVRTSVRDQLR